MTKFLADEWSAIKRWWSVWVGVLTAALLAAVPVVAERWPDLAPGFIALFPKHGEQLAPLVGVLLTVAARLISQAAVVEAFRRMFRRKEKEGGDGAA